MRIQWVSRWVSDPNLDQFMKAKVHEIEIEKRRSLAEVVLGESSLFGPPRKQPHKALRPEEWTKSLVT